MGETVDKNIGNMLVLLKQLRKKKALIFQNLFI